LGKRRTREEVLEEGPKSEGEKLRHKQSEQIFEYLSKSTEPHKYIKNFDVIFDEFFKTRKR
jgi:hypothetical protein